MVDPLYEKYKQTFKDCARRSYQNRRYALARHRFEKKGYSDEYIKQYLKLKYDYDESDEKPDLDKEPDTRRDYHSLKTEFDEKICFIYSAKKYIHENPDTGPELVSKDDIRKYYGELYYYNLENNRKYNFFNRYFKDTNKVVYLTEGHYLDSIYKKY